MLMKKDETSDPLEVARRLVAIDALRAARGGIEDSSDHSRVWDAAKIAWLNRHQLRACPRCQYDLEGLPTKGKCPECGIAYARDSYSFTPSNKVKWMNRHAALFAVFAVLAGTPVVFTGIRDALRFVCACLALTSLIIAFINWIRDPCFVDYLIIDSHGFRIARRGHGELAMSWQDIGGVRTNREGCVVLETKHDRARIVMPYTMIPTQLDAQLFEMVAKTFIDNPE